MWIFGKSLEKEWSEVMKRADDASAQRRYHDVEAELSKGVQIAAKFGDNDARYASTLYRLAEHLQLMGEFERADPLYEKAIKVFAAIQGDFGKEVAHTLWRKGLNQSNQPAKRSAAE